VRGRKKQKSTRTLSLYKYRYQVVCYSTKDLYTYYTSTDAGRDTQYHRGTASRRKTSTVAKKKDSYRNSSTYTTNTDTLPVYCTCTSLSTAGTSSSEAENYPAGTQVLTRTVLVCVYATTRPSTSNADWYLYRRLVQVLCVVLEPTSEPNGIVRVRCPRVRQNNPVKYRNSHHYKYSVFKNYYCDL
jgi:hypothetical protein